MNRWTTARYGRMRQRGLFEVETSEEVEAGDRCVLKTPRGYELGTVLARPIETRSEAEGCGDGACGSCASPQGTVVRLATDQDWDAHRKVEEDGTFDLLRTLRRESRDIGLRVKIVDAEFLLRREKLIVHYSAPDRLDFRELIKRISKSYDTRIEMRQIGARDEARMVGDIAACGRELCCRTFLHDLQPVSMRMAKQQKKTLDPTKISGQCGKLKCCLRYEDEVYTELQKTMPKRGKWVRIEQGVGRIVTVDLLLQKLVVQVMGGGRVVVHTSQLLETGLPAPSQDEQRSAPSRSGPRGRGAPAAGPAQPRPKRIEPLQIAPSVEPTSETTSEPTSEPAKEAPAAPESKSAESSPRAAPSPGARSKREQAPRSDTPEKRPSDSAEEPAASERVSSRSRSTKERRRREPRKREPAEARASSPKGESEEEPKRESRGRRGGKRPRGERGTSGGESQERGDRPNKEDSPEPRRRKKRTSGSGSGSGGGERSSEGRGQRRQKSSSDGGQKKPFSSPESAETESSSGGERRRRRRRERRSDNS